MLELLFTLKLSGCTIPIVYGVLVLVIYIYYTYTSVAVSETCVVSYG